MLRSGAVSIKGLVNIRGNIASLAYAYCILSLNKASGFRALVR